MIYRNRKKTTSPIILFILTFLLIYGPKLFGLAFLDFISITSFLIIFFAVFIKREKIIMNTALKIPIVILSLLVIYSLLVIIISANYDFLYPMKFLRTLLNYLGIYFLCLWYWQRYGEFSKYKCLKFIFLATSLHALIMIIQYINVDFAGFVNNLSGIDSRKTKWRVTGLTISFNSLALTQGFGFLIGLVLQQNIVKTVSQKIIHLILMGLLFSSLLISGRTASYGILLISSFILFLKYREYIIRGKILFLCLSFLSIGIFLYFFASDDIISTFLSYTLEQYYAPFKMLGGYSSEYDHHVVNTIKILFENMIILPESTLILFFGSALSGRGDVYVASDIGYVLSIFGIGIVGTFMMVFFYIYSLIQAFKWKRFSSWIAFLSALQIIAILVLNMKEQVLLTRHIFSQSAMLFCLLQILILSQKDNSVNKSL